jgi:linoleoyl-CoA desaturase
MTVQEQFAQIRSSITPEQDKKALRTLWLKSIFILVCFFSSYAVSVYYDGPFWINFVACVIAALSTGAILLNIVHEAVHYTYSKKKSINQLWGFSLTILGSSSILWRERHTHSHHTDTNVINADVDVPPTNQNLIRVSKEQKRMWFHKFQHLYALYIYATFPIFNVFVEEFVALATNKCQVKEKKLRLKIFLEMMLAKVIYIYFYIYTPIEQFGWLKGLIYILVFNFVAGISALFPLIVGHITEGSPMYNKG